jgi:hypothetical protein
MLCARRMAAVQAHRQAHWQVGHGFLGLPSQNGMAKLRSPARRLRRTSFWVAEARGKPPPRRIAVDGRVRCASRNRTERRARRRARGTGQGCSGRSGRACGVCTATCTVQSAARGSVRYGGALGTAWQRRCLDQPLVCARDGGCQGARGCLPSGPYVQPARERGTVRSCVALRLLLAFDARRPATACGVGVHLGGHGSRERLRGKPSRPIHRRVARGISVCRAELYAGAAPATAPCRTESAMPNRLDNDERLQGLSGGTTPKPTCATYRLGRHWGGHRRHPQARA